MGKVATLEYANSFFSNKLNLREFKVRDGKTEREYVSGPVFEKARARFNAYWKEIEEINKLKADSIAQSDLQIIQRGYNTK